MFCISNNLIYYVCNTYSVCCPSDRQTDGCFPWFVIVFWLNIFFVLLKQCYKMGRRPRGRVLIINNKIFFGPLEEDENGKKRVTLATREGTEQDERKIQEVFEQMFFVVDVHMDKKGEVSTGKPIEWKKMQMAMLLKIDLR